MADWIPIFVLPNILFKDPVENEYVAVVSPDDPRCAQIAREQPNFMPFLAAFTDAFKRSVVPSVLLVKAGSPPWVMSMEAIGGFRDAISISTVTHNRSLTIVHGHAKPHQYSTFFDFYAWAFSKSFDVLTTNNPALWGMEQFEDFAGQSTPGISVSRWDRLDYDSWRLCWANGRGGFQPLRLLGEASPCFGL
jgi:hypothetical protein